MKRKPPKSLWKRLTWGAVIVLVLIIFLVIDGCGRREAELQKELNELSSTVTRAMGRIPVVMPDYDQMGRDEAKALETELSRLLEEVRAEHEAMLDAHRHASPYFKGRSRVSEMAEKDTLLLEQARVNEYINELPNKVEQVRNKATALYNEFATEGIKPLNQWHSPQTTSLAKPYLSRAEEDACRLLKECQDKLNAFKRKCYNYNDDDCDLIGDQANNQITLRIKPRLTKLEHLTARRRAFYNSNVEHEHLSTAPGSFDATANKALIFKEISADAPKGAYNLCSKPHTVLQELEAFLAAMPGSLEPLRGKLLNPLSQKREYKLANADLRFTVTADLDTTLVRHLLKDWLRGEQSPYGNSGVAFYEPTDASQREWLVVQHVSNAPGKHPEPFNNELWIHIKTLGTNEQAADHLCSDNQQTDLLITGDNIPSELKESRRYDLNLMSRLCSDAVLLVDCSKGSKSNMVLQPAQVLGTATEGKTLTRIFFPEGSAARRISDTFGLTPIAGDVTLPTADMNAARNMTEGALVVPWHLSNTSQRIYAMALPTIEARGQKQEAEQKRYGRPANAACHPSSNSIRSHDYSLSYDINIFTLHDSDICRSFRNYCSSPAGQTCVQRRNYVPLRNTNNVEFHALTVEDLPVKPVIEQLHKAGCGLGYTGEEEQLFGFKLSNVAFFETNQTNPMEVQIDAADEESLSVTMEHLLKAGTIGSEFAVVVIGHADIRGSQANNLSLSERRSMSAAQKMLYNVPGGDKLKGGKTNKNSLLHFNKQEGIGLVTLGCGIWRPLTSNEVREAAKKAKVKSEANDLLRHDRRVEFFIIVPKSRGLQADN